MDSNPGGGRIFFGWWIVLAAGLVGLWAGTVFYGITAFINPIVTDMRWSYLAVSVAMSLRSVEMGFLSPFTGYLSDRVGARWVVLTASMIVGAGFLILSRLDSLFSFYAGYIVLSIGLSGIGHSALLTPIANWFRRNLGKAIGLSMMGYGLSGLLIPVLTAMIEAWHWRNVFMVLGFISWVILIPAAMLLRQRPEPYGMTVDGLPPATGLDGLPGELEDSDPPSSSRFLALRTRAFWMLSLSMGGFSLVLNIVSLYMLPYLETRSVPTKVAAMIVMCLPLASVPGRFFLGWLGDVMDKRTVLLASFATMSASLFLVYFCQALWVYWLFVTIFGISFGGIFSLRSAIIRDYFGRHCFGSVQGMSTPIMVTGGMMGPLVAGAIFDSKVNVEITWLVCALICLASMPLVLAMGAKQHR